MIKEACKNIITDKLIVLSEKNSKITFQNSTKSKIVKVDVENCQLKNEKGEKSDFLLLKNNRDTFIELKGKDVKKAISQLSNSILKLSDEPKKSNKSAFIVHTKNPFNAAVVKTFKNEFNKKFNAILTVTKSNKTFLLK